MNTTNMLKCGAAIITLAILAILVNAFWGTQKMAGMGPASTSRQPLYWVAPMDPDYRRDEPGLSPMGMELVPVFEETNAGNGVTISPTVQQNLGVRLGKVTTGKFQQHIEAIGYTAWDQTSIQMVHPRTEGWLETFQVASVGDRVKADQTLYQLFSPRLISAQREYLNAVTGTSLRQSAEERLLALGLTQVQIADLTASNDVSHLISYRAEKDAIVSGIGARAGSYVTPESTILTLASLDQVWVDIELPTTVMPWIDEGLPVIAKFPAFPGEQWPGQIDLVYPELDPVTRSLRLRLVIDNPDHRLKPNMFATVQVQGPSRLNIISVPREALIRSGQGSRVLIAAGDGQFNVQPVRTGMVSGERIEITQGLSEGLTVVTSGQFLLDSEANGEQAMARINVSDSALQTTSNTADNTDQQTFTGQGVIQEITNRRVMLNHAPIPALDWPQMIMGFQTDPAIDLSRFSEGEEIEFDFIPQEIGGYSIIALRPLSSTQQGGTQ